MLKHYDLESPEEMSVNYRWMQPPQIAYFVSTIDEFGNPNLTPVTLGTFVCAQYPRDGKAGSYFFTFSIGCRTLNDKGNVVESRQGFKNLQKNGECVISYLGSDLLRQSIICNMPIPHGISEFDVAGLTAVASQKVKPFSVEECAVNMECKVVHSYNLDGYYQMFVCRVVGVSVRPDYIENDEQTGGYGILASDPIFEVQVEPNAKKQLRLSYAKLNLNEVFQPGAEFGCAVDWVGNFNQWIVDEHQRGKISANDMSDILVLYKQWNKNRNPETNLDVKDKLTNYLKKICKSESNDVNPKQINVKLK